MATFKILNIETFALSEPHTSTDWEIAKDREFKEILDSSIEDPVNLLEWRTPILTSDGPYDGGYPVYGRIRVRYGLVPSPYYYFDPCNERGIEIT